MAPRSDDETDEDVDSSCGLKNSIQLVKCEAIDTDVESEDSGEQSGITEKPLIKVILEKQLMENKSYDFENLEIKCTACGQQLNHKVLGFVYKHPLLNVIVCKKCFDNNTYGSFEQDDDGVDDFCRWCAEGGNLVCCDFCNKTFCAQCIRRNFGRVELAKIKMVDEWRCFVCDPTPTACLVDLCVLVIENLKRKASCDKVNRSGPTAPVVRSLSFCISKTYQLSRELRSVTRELQRMLIMESTLEKCQNVSRTLNKSISLTRKRLNTIQTELDVTIAKMQSGDSSVDDVASFVRVNETLPNVDEILSRLVQSSAEEIERFVNEEASKSETEELLLNGDASNDKTNGLALVNGEASMEFTDTNDELSVINGKASSERMEECKTSVVSQSAAKITSVLKDWKLNTKSPSPDNDVEADSCLQTSLKVDSSDTSDLSGSSVEIRDSTESDANGIVLTSTPSSRLQNTVPETSLEDNAFTSLVLDPDEHISHTLSSRNEDLSGFVDETQSDSADKSKGDYEPQTNIKSTVKPDKFVASGNEISEEAVVVINSDEHINVASVPLIDDSELIGRVVEDSILSSAEETKNMSVPWISSRNSTAKAYKHVRPEEDGLSSSDKWNSDAVVVVACTDAEDKTDDESEKSHVEHSGKINVKRKKQVNVKIEKSEAEIAKEELFRAFNTEEDEESDALEKNSGRNDVTKASKNLASFDTTTTDDSATTAKSKSKEYEEETSLSKNLSVTSQSDSKSAKQAKEKCAASSDSSKRSRLKLSPKGVVTRRQFKRFDEMSFSTSSSEDDSKMVKSTRRRHKIEQCYTEEQLKHAVATDPKLKQDSFVVLNRLVMTGDSMIVPDRRHGGDEQSDTEKELRRTMASLRNLRKRTKKRSLSDSLSEDRVPRIRNPPRSIKKSVGYISLSSSSTEESESEENESDMAKRILEGASTRPATDRIDENDGMDKVAKEALASLLATSSEESETEEEGQEKKKESKKPLKPQSDDDFVDIKTRKKCTSEDEISPALKRRRRALKFRLSDTSDSDKASKKKTRRTQHMSSTSGSDSNSTARQKKDKVKKRRRIVQLSDSTEENDSDCEFLGKTVSDSQTSSPGKKGRKNIRKVIKDSKLRHDTKHAAREEEERIKRVKEMQKLYNEVVEGGGDRAPVTTKLCLLENPVTKEPLLQVHPKLICKLKPHQVNGVKFMWECIGESLDQLQNHPGSGCILGHCMGLGKTLQVITLVHTLLRNKVTGIKTCLVLCPLNTVLNWFREFKMWLEDVDSDKDIKLTELTSIKVRHQRAFEVSDWFNVGGVLILGYDMFRNLTNEKTKIPIGTKKIFQKSLLDPGPDIVICDEGHVLKNSKTAISKTMERIRTLRRIILTGTPLQNNLAEYHCMVSFVKPNLLGSMKEFQNRFMNPINNGQCADSTAYDVRLMKRRAHVLHNLLDGCVQRKDYAVLVPFLPPKHEYVISIKLTELQIKLYDYYLEHFARKGSKSCLFMDYQILSRIWTHPIVLRLAKLREENKNADDSESSFINDSTTESDSSVICSGDEHSKQLGDERKPLQTDNLEDEILKSKQGEWWIDIYPEEEIVMVELSNKLVILFDILRECETIGDKLLVFSQSLLSLDLIEDILLRFGTGTPEQPKPFVHGFDYFRMDGSTSADFRSRYTTHFNDQDNDKARLFLISTKAGSLGINLVKANRVVIFDASWNPTHDIQSIFRVYRFGQEKPVYIYRFLAHGTMEEKIYDRQVAKQSLSIRVLDEQQVDRHFTFADLQELYRFEPDSVSKRPTPMVPKDRLLAELLMRHKDLIVNYHEHDSLLVNVVEEELSEDDRKAAWVEYEFERKGMLSDADPMGTGIKFDVAQIVDDIQTKHPGITYDELMEKVNHTVLMLQEARVEKVRKMQQQAVLKMQQQQMQQMLQQQQLQQFHQQQPQQFHHLQPQQLHQRQPQPYAWTRNLNFPIPTNEKLQRNPEGQNLPLSSPHITSATNSALFSILKNPQVPVAHSNDIYNIID